MPQINLLPWRQQERVRTQREFTLAVTAVLMVSAAVTLFTSWGISAAIDRQQERNRLLKHEISELDKQITEIIGLEAEKQRMHARMDVVERLQRSRPEVVHVFDQLARTVPDGVYLTSVKQSDRRLELIGFAQSSTRVSTFMRNIEASQWLADPQLQVIETLKQGRTGADFTLLAMQKSVLADEDQKARRPAGAPGS
jgi:type IV pilus assembly protein PilN